MADQTLEEFTKGLLPKHPNTHFMLIDGMSKLMSSQVKTCESSDFLVSGVRWRLLIRSNTAKNHISFYVKITDDKCDGSNWEVKCTIRFSLVSKTRHDICPSFPASYKRKIGSGEPNFIPYTVLKEMYIVSDKAVFGAEITGVQPSFSVTPIVRTIGTAERIKLVELPPKNSRFTWKITQFSSFNGKRHTSNEYALGSRRWKLAMYPKGDSSANGYLSLYLNATDDGRNGPNGTTLAVFKLRVFDQLKRNHYETINEGWFRFDSEPKKNSVGDNMFLSLDELHKASRGFLVNDEIYFTVEFLFVSTTEKL